MVADPTPDVRALRRAPRRKLFQPAELRQGTASVRVHLLDLSTAGALVHATQPVESGAMAILTCGALTRSARVVWVVDRRIGLAFVMPLSEKEVDSVITTAERPAAAARS